MESPIYPTYFVRCMNGCLSASTGVQRRSGLRFRHRSNKSMNPFSSFDSASVIPGDAAARSLVFSSLTGLLKVSVLVMSYTSRNFSRAQEDTLNELPFTFPVILSFSTLLKLSISSKCKPVNFPLRSTFCGNFPRHSMIERSIWLLVRPVNKIFPVNSS